MDKELEDEAYRFLFQAVGQSLYDAIYDDAFDIDKLTEILEDYCKSPAARKYYNLANNSPRKPISRSKLEADFPSIGDLEDQMTLAEFYEKAKTEV